MESSSSRARAVRGLIVALVLVLSSLVGVGSSGATWSGSGAEAAARVDVQGAGMRAAPQSVSLVISQVYGGGGNSGAPWRNDFMEIFNPTAAPVVISGWSLQYASAAGSTWQITPLNATIPAGAYYLVQQGSGGANGQPLPAPDVVGTINMSAQAGKVALVSNTTALMCGTTGNRCLPNPSIIDLVGFGATAQDWEGTGPVGTLSNSTSASRQDGGCIDTDDNASDFLVISAITPRNSAYPHNPCGGATPTVTVTPGGPTFTPTATWTVGLTNTPSNTPTGVQTPPSGCNSLVNGGFEVGAIEPWYTTTPGITGVVDSSIVHSGDFSVAITHAFTQTGGGSQGIQQEIPSVTEGQVYPVEGYVYRPDNNLQSARVRVAWYNCADFSCGQASTIDIFAGNRGVPDWQYFSGNVTAPAGALAARYRLIFYNATNTPSTIYFDDVLFGCQAGGTSTPTPTGPTVTPSASTTAIPIGSVQGFELESPMVGQTVTIRGTVTVILGNGFFVQDAGDGDPTTSDGVFVFTSSFPGTVSVGSDVTVRGRVSEFRSSTRPCDLRLTELTSPVVTVNGTGTLPVPLVINNVPEDTVIYPNAVDYYERLEGMLVRVNNTVVIGPTNPAFGEFWVLAGGDQTPGSGYLTEGHIFVLPTPVPGVDYNPERILVDDEGRIGGGNNGRIVGTDGQSRLNAKDRVASITGALDYQFSNYRIQPLYDPEAMATRLPVPPPPISNLPTPAADEFRVNTFNMENYFDRIDDPNKSDDIPTQAEILTKTLKLTQAISVELGLPDILILEEIESAAVVNGDANGNVPGTNVRSIVRRFADVGIPYNTVSREASDGRSIEVGFLYRTDRAALSRYYLSTDFYPDPPSWDGGREPLVGHFTIGNHDLMIIGNHWKSKNGDEPLFGDAICQPPVRTTEDLRKRQAQYVRTFINNMETFTPTLKVLVGGDLNDFYFPEPGEGRDPVTILKGSTISDTSVLVNLIEQIPAAGRYSYVFDGNSQVLDHILVNPNLDAFRRAQAIANYNSSFHGGYEDDTSVPYRTTDHDQIMGYFAVQSLQTATPTATPTTTRTQTATLTPTTTYTRTPTATQTATVTPPSTTTFTHTPTFTSTPTFTHTPTFTNTPTFTSTHTHTSTHTPTRTHTGVATNTPVNTPTNTPTAVLTNTSVPSSTPTPPGATPSSTSTRTACTIYFSDVNPSDYFYWGVRDLTCVGVISGYSDGTFRPYNNTTRAQMCKIVVLAFGYEMYVPTTPTFLDVPQSDTFFAYVETAVLNGIAVGYADGTFRPYNNVTRGQLAKLAVAAAQWPLINPPLPTFSDVPSDNVFYPYVETAYCHDIISGYEDGTFRPGNYATRGQIAKIVYEAVTGGRNCVR